MIKESITGIVFNTQQINISDTAGVEQNFVNLNTPQDFTKQIQK